MPYEAKENLDSADVNQTDKEMEDIANGVFTANFIAMVQDDEEKARRKREAEEAEEARPDNP